jgi:hypothetical protein
MFKWPTATHKIPPNTETIFHEVSNMLLTFCNLRTGREMAWLEVADCPRPRDLADLVIVDLDGK